MRAWLEIAGALGAGLVIFGDVGQLGELLVVNLGLFNVDAAQSEGRVTIEAPSLESFPGQLKPKAWDLLTPKMIALGFDVPERPTETEPVRLVKEISTPEKPLIAWPGAFLAGTLFLVGAGGAGFWYSDVDSNLRTLYDVPFLEEDGDLLSALSKRNRCSGSGSHACFVNNHRCRRCRPCRFGGGNIYGTALGENF